MSCKTKLGTFPTLSDLDKSFKKLTSGSVSTSELRSRVANQVKNTVNEVTGKLSEVGGLLNNLGKDMKVGITDDLKSIGPGIVKSVENAKKEISQQLSNIKDLLECEKTTTSTEAETVEQANKIQSAATTTSKNELKNMSNKEIKTLSESPKAQEIKTETVAQKSAEAANTTASSQKTNQVVVEKQSTSVKVLETTPTLNVKDRRQTLEYSIYTQQLKSMDSSLAAAIKAVKLAGPFTSADDKELKIREQYTKFKTTVTIPVNNVCNDAKVYTYDDAVVLLAIENEKGKVIVARVQVIEGTLTTKQLNTIISESLKKIDQLKAKLIK